MISEELRSRMRRLFFAEHWKVGTICAELGVHHDTVSHAIEASRFINVKYRAQDSVLEPYKSFIQLTLKDHPKLLATRLFDMITPRGYAGSVVQLRRYVRAIRPPAHQEAFFRLRTLPGEQAQVDWGCFGFHPHRQGQAGAVVLRHGAGLVARRVRVLHPRPDPGELRPLPCARLRVARRRAARSALRQPQDGCAGAAGRSHPLPSTPARAGGPLPLRHQAVRALPGKREGEGRAGHSLPALLVLRRPRVLLRRRPQRAARHLDRDGRPHAPGARRPRRPPGRRGAHRGEAAPAPAAAASLRERFSCGPRHRARRRTSASISTTTPSRTPS